MSRANVIFDLDGTPTDSRESIARRNTTGYPVSGVTYGYGSAEELIEAGAHVLCRSPEALAGLLTAVD